MTKSVNGRTTYLVLIDKRIGAYPFLSRCAGLILPSYHEGFGLVLAEADVLGLPVCASNIPGPRGFMEKHKGFLFPNTDEGVEEGIRYLLGDSAHVMNVDYDAYNKAALDAFYSLLKD